LQNTVSPSLGFIDVEMEARSIFNMQSLVQLTLPLLLQHVESVDDIRIGGGAVEVGYIDLRVAEIRADLYPCDGD
jgi:hypothetical protein